MANTKCIKCPKCKGRGYILDINPFLAMEFTRCLDGLVADK